MALDPALIARVEKALAALGEQNIAHEKLGSFGFQEAQALIDQFRSTAGGLLTRAKAHSTELNPTNIAPVLDGILAQLTEIGAHVEQIKQLAQQVNTPDFPNQKKAQMKFFKSINPELESKTIWLSTELRMRDLENRIDEGAIEAAQQRLELLTKTAETSAAQIEAILNAQRTQTAQAGVNVAATGFGILQRKHWFLAWCWFVGVVLFGAAVGGAVYWALFGPTPPGTDNLTLVAYVFKRVLAISAPLAGMRMCLSKFNLERNLQIVYDHRQTVLDQYPGFDSAMSDNEAKNNFRLEIAKFIFSDPNTGYVPDTGGPELNINPIIGALEKATAKPG